MLRTTHQWDAAPAGALSQGLHAAALCGDFRYPWGSSAAPLAGRERALARAVGPPRTWPFDRATASRNGFVRQCLPWPPTPPTPSVPVALPAVPICFLEGDHDLSAPLEWGAQEAALAPRGKLVVVPRNGAQRPDARPRICAGRRAVAAFLLRVEARPGTRVDCSIPRTPARPNGWLPSMTPVSDLDLQPSSVPSPAVEPVLERRPAGRAARAR